jgi:lysophospholipase L1-like esterase
MPAGDHVNYFGMGEQIERYMGRFEVLQAALCEELGVPFLSYATDLLFNIDEQLYLDSAHYTPLMHSLLAMKLNEDLNRFM